MVDLLFTLFEFNATEMHPWHPFYQPITFPNGFVWDGKVSDSTFVYGFMAMLSRAMIFLAAYLAVSHRLFLRIFIICFWVELADSVDYYLTRNGYWFKVDRFLFFENWEFEFNYIKLGVIFYFTSREWTAPA